MRIRVSACIMAAAMLLGAIPALALDTVHLNSDADMLSFLSDTLFVGEGRIGDGLGHATFELDLGRETSNPGVTSQFDWQNGVSVPWTLSYDSGTNAVTFTVGDSVLAWTSELSGFTDIFLRTRAVVAESDIMVDDLFIDGEAVNDVSNAIGADGLDILWIQGASVFDGFVITGQTTMAWGATKPTQSKLAFQIKVGKLKPTATEPTSWGQVKALYR